MSKILVSERRFLGAVAKWATEQSPYHRPDNLELVLDKLHVATKDLWPKDNLYFIEFVDHKDLGAFVKSHLRAIPEYELWNERKNGNPAPLKFTSRYDAPGDPDDDFIDLDALERNVTNELLEDDLTVPQINAAIKKLPDTNGVSDGYHTFGELYDHRITLYLALCRTIDQSVGHKYIGAIWRSKYHHDGSNFEGWFILGISLVKGEQISYHLPMDRWHEADFAVTLDKAPEWDGHTPADVIERLKTL